jgi:hypothetical protein
MYVAGLYRRSMTSDDIATRWNAGGHRPAASSLDICKGPRMLSKVLESRNLHVISQGVAPSKPESAIPSFEEGSLRPVKKCRATLKQGAAGEVRLLSQQSGLTSLEAARCRACAARPAATIT